MDVADGPVECDWRVDITSCGDGRERTIVQAVLIIWRHSPKTNRVLLCPLNCRLARVWDVRSLSIFLVIIDAFPNSTIVQELISEIAVCCSFPCWACFVIGVWYATPKLSVPGDNMKIRVPRPQVMNSVFAYLLFGPFLLDLPSVISSGTFLSRRQYTKTNISIATHFITLAVVISVAMIIFWLTLDQLAKAIAEYTVPSNMTLVHVGVTPAALDGSGGQTFTLSPLPESEKEEQIWDTSLAKVRLRLISIRNAGTLMLCFYITIYLIYGIARPMIHEHIVWNIFFCVCFNLDPGTPTIFAYFIFSILYHVHQGPPQLPEVYSLGPDTSSVSRPPAMYMPPSRPTRPRSDSYLYDLHRPATHHTFGAGVRSSSLWPPSPAHYSSGTASLDLTAIDSTGPEMKEIESPYHSAGDPHTLLEALALSPTRSSTNTLRS
ncbi:hypothetical protein EMPS_10286 [Entomortierella parvispora]|uniref:Uncharacterized protein n=1 Tax=Entomortierella parvispora TaxID=205924 RepID=A0A9P3HKI7_9FUNG|nr:hypothetical protein EMPS_10286 [Entomortierella parvispora]